MLVVNTGWFLCVRIVFVHSLLWLILVRQKYHGRAGERCRVPMPPEFEPSTDEGHLTFRRVVVPPCRIRPRRDEAHHQRTALAFLICLPHPQADCAAIGRVHPAAPRPRLRQPVILAGVVARALRIFGRGAHVEFQRAIQSVHPVEEVLRSRPVVGRAGEVNRNAEQGEAARPASADWFSMAGCSGVGLLVSIDYSWLPAGRCSLALIRILSKSYRSVTWPMSHRSCPHSPRA